MTQIYLNMPQPGETITEGSVVQWLVSEGTLITQGMPVVELETEKAVFEYESPFEGVLKKILVSSQTMVPVGQPLAIFEVEPAKAKAYQSLGLGFEAPATSTIPTPSQPVLTPQQQKSQTLEPPSQIRPLSPYIRALVRQQGITQAELKTIKATGPQGRLTKEDLVAHLKNRGASSVEKQPKPSSLKPGHVMACDPIRLRIAENMLLSKSTIPHAHTGLEVDVTPFMEYRAQYKADFERKHHLSLGILPLMIPSLKKAIQQYPVVNAQFIDSQNAKGIFLFDTINLGIAIDTPKGLMTPVIHGIEKMSFIDFAKQLEALLDRAAKNKLSPREMEGMTFTFNNFGYFGTTLGIQVVPPGQSSILGMGRIEKKPWVFNNTLTIRSIAPLVMAFDHRVLDGRDAGLFLKMLKTSMEDFSGVDLFD